MWNENLHRSPAPARALCLSVLLFAAASLTATDLPDGAGKAEITRVCSKCHSLEQATSLRQGQAAWKETISKMVNLGAEAKDAEFTAIFDYLVKNFGPANASPSSAVAQPTAAAPPPDATKPNAPATSTAPRSTAPFNPGPPLPPASEWPTYGHDSGGQRFSPLTEISPDNVARLKIAWTYHMRPANFTGGAAGGAVMEGRGPGGAVGDSPETPTPGRNGGGRGGRFGSGFRPSGDTPLVKGGIMYMATPYSRVVAVDPVTGQELWSFPLPSGSPSTRGLEYWAGDGKTPPQLVFGSSDGKLYSVDAKTGKANPAFGDNGIVNINTDAIMHGLPGRNGLSSPPVVYKNLVITGGTTQENPPHGPAGDVRAWDMRTGKLAWTFHSIPQKGEKFGDTWAADSAGIAPASTSGASSRSTKNAASSTCPSARPRSINTAATAPATISSAPASSPPMPTPANTSGTSRWFTTTSGMPI